MVRETDYVMLGGVHMYLKKLIVLMSFLGCLFFFSLDAYAMPVEDADIFDTFGIDQDDVLADAKNGGLGLYAKSSAGTFTLQTESELGLDGINDFGDFFLSKGFSKLSVTTFADSKVLSGKGAAKTVVGVHVFSISKDGGMITTNTSVQEIGASGIYNCSFSLKLGENNILIAVMDDDNVLYRLYKVTVKQEETKGILENIQINFIPSDPGSSNSFSISDLPGLDTK